MFRFLHFLRTIVSYRRLILSMARRIIIAQYVGSSLGFFWVVIQPLSMISILWAVFGLAFSAQPLNGSPFVVWLTAGLAAWYVFSEVVSGSVGVIIENQNLIKKMAFPSQILPVVKMVTSLVNHMVFILVLLVLLYCHKLSLSFYAFQFFYYLFALLMLALGLSWLGAALNPFFRDVGPFVGLFMQIGMWATPIVWEIKMMPEAVQFYFTLNPMYYIVQGYRDTFIYARPFWDYPQQTCIFWLTTMFFLAAGGYAFKALKPHFADVL
jgi:ABC-type polysaccharide/polyol phosphate export permease